MKTDLISRLETYLSTATKPYKKIIFVCIGTDRSTGDSFGPMVGSILKQSLDHENIEIYGTIHEPVHAKNLIDTLNSIDQENNLIIAIDACLGNNIGKVLIENKPIRPGAAMGKKLGSVGDISIKGIVNEDRNSDLVFKTMQNTRLSVVWDLAELATDVIVSTFSRQALKEVACEAQ